MNIRQKILKSDDLRRESYQLPTEWGGGTVYIRELTAADRDSYEAYAAACNGAPLQAQRLQRAVLAVMSLVDEKGRRIFKDDDIERMGKKNHSFVHEIWIAALRINGWMKTPEDRAIRDPALLQGIFAGIVARQEKEPRG